MTTLFHFNSLPTPLSAEERPSNALCAFSSDQWSSDAIRQAISLGYRGPLITDRLFDDQLDTPHLFLHAPYPLQPLSDEEWRRQLQLVQHCIETHQSTDSDKCAMWIQVDPETCEWLRKKSIEEHTMVKDEKTGKMRRHQVEISGRFLLYQIASSPARFLVKIDKNSVKGGKEEAASSVNAIGSCHTHPYEAYVKHQVCMAWPSYDDYVVFLDIYSKGYGAFHIIGTVEGLYIITISRELQDEGREKIQKNFKYYEKYIKEHYHTDYPSCDISRALYHPDSEEYREITQEWKEQINDYVHQMNRKKYFRLQFVLWKDAVTPDHFPIWIEFKGIGQTCAVDDHQVESGKILERDKSEVVFTGSSPRRTPSRPSRRPR